MSRIQRCPRCGGNIVTPAYEGDGAYPIAPMCSCDRVELTKSGREMVRVIRFLDRQGSRDRAEVDRDD